MSEQTITLQCPCGTATVFDVRADTLEYAARCCERAPVVVLKQTDEQAKN